jgi:hypothetical protein
VTRREFNTVYVESVKLLKEVQARTGLRVNMENLAGMVVVDPQASLDGPRNAVYMGWYLQDTQVSTLRFYITMIAHTPIFI